MLTKKPIVFFSLCIILLSACSGNGIKNEKSVQQDSANSIEVPPSNRSQDVFVRDSTLLKNMIDGGMLMLDSLVGVKNSLKHKDAALDKRIDDLKGRLDSLLIEDSALIQSRR